MDEQGWGAEGETRHSDERLAAIKKNLRAGKLEAEDLRVLESIVERTEAATRQLRAAIVE